MRIPESELILNPDGSIYHLNLLPGDIAHTIITVGDQDRVDQVSSYFDSIEVRKQHREFKTHTGSFKGKRLTVISTGIGPDNIDIVFNELDALVNIDLETREVREHLTKLNFIRVGTSGALQPEIKVGSLLASELGIGFDNLMHFYQGLDDINDKQFSLAFMKHTEWNQANSQPYVVQADPDLMKQYVTPSIEVGVTTTNVGFYGPQGRKLRLPLQDKELNKLIGSFEYRLKRITNLEMETAAIYGMSRLLGHRALSLNVILANRANETFSDDPKRDINRLIEYTLERFLQADL